MEKLLKIRVRVLKKNWIPPGIEPDTSRSFLTLDFEATAITTRPQHLVEVCCFQQPYYLIQAGINEEYSRQESMKRVISGPACCRQYTDFQVAMLKQQTRRSRNSHLYMAIMKKISRWQGHV